MLKLPDLKLGRLLAEGGEGRVFELDLSADAAAALWEEHRAWDQCQEPLLLKQFRQSRPLDEVERLVKYPGRLVPECSGRLARVVSSSAWPLSSVVNDNADVAVGAVIPRAPAQFWLSHRDGPLRLATLSYLAGDPDRVELAYGARVPPPGAALRVGVVYALARLLETWAAPPSVVHGDLSAKNVLWSVSPAPAVYVLDCDGARLLDGSSVGDGPGPPPRPNTPNWDDPALGAGEPPGESSDRYVLALTFLRVVGAAHFPLQGRQRALGEVSVDLELPRSWRKLPDMPGLWQLCERGLSVLDVAGRPSPAEWADELEHLLDRLGGAGVAASVRHAQGDSVPSAAGNRAPGPRARPPDVVVRPVLRDRGPSTWQLVNPRGALMGPEGEMLVSAASPVAPMSARMVARRGWTMWGRAHRLAARTLRYPGRRAYGARRLASMVVVDLAGACVGLFLVGMVVSPWIGL